MRTHSPWPEIVIQAGACIENRLNHLHNMSKGSGTMPASTLADDKLAGMDHAEVHYFNRY